MEVSSKEHDEGCGREQTKHRAASDLTNQELFRLNTTLSDFSLIMDCFRGQTLKVNRAREAKKRALVFDTARIKHIDFLQEAHSNGGNWDKEREGQVPFILFSRRFTPSSLEVGHVRGRYLLARPHFETHTLELELIRAYKRMGCGVLFILLFQGI